MRRYLPFLITAAVVVLIQVITTLTGTQYYLTQLIMTAWYALVVIGLCLLMGYTGQISIGHAAFFAIGGYTTAVLTTTNLIGHESNWSVALLVRAGLTIEGANSWGESIRHVSPWIATILAVVISASVAYVIGIPVLRLKGHYLAMATLGFGTIVYRIVLGTQVFGAADGIAEIPSFNVLPGIVIDGARSHRLGSYYFSWGVVLLCMVMMGNLIHSRAGRAIRAIHGNEEAARAMGVDTAAYKLRMFVVSAVIAAIAGVFMTHYNGNIGPVEASITRSVRYVAIVAVGGMANLWGALIAASVLNFLSLRGLFGSFDDAVFGSVLIAMMLFAPRGIILKRKKRASAEAGGGPVAQKQGEPAGKGAPSGEAAQEVSENVLR